MNESRDIQHPDITQAEKTGYPWFPRKITVEATQEHAKNLLRQPRRRLLRLSCEVASLHRFELPGREPG